MAGFRVPAVRRGFLEEDLAGFLVETIQASVDSALLEEDSVAEAMAEDLVAMVFRDLLLIWQTWQDGL